MRDTTGGAERVGETQDRSRRVGAFIDALARVEHDGDVETIAALFTEHAEIGNPLEAARPYHGSVGARAYWRAYRAAFHNVRSELRHLAETGDVAMLEWTSSARTAAGESIYYQGVTVLEFSGDRIRRFRSYFDPADLHEHPDPHGTVGA